MKKAMHFVSSIALASLLAASGPGIPRASAGEGNGKGHEKDVCVYSAHGSDEERAQNAKGGPGSGGGGKQDTCSKTYAKWTGSAIRLFLNTGGWPAAISAATFADCASKAFAEWSCHSGLGEAVVFTTASDAASADITLGWGNLGTTGILGQTTTNYFSGVISHSSIVMNSNQAAFQWTAGPSPSVDGDGCAVEVGNGNTSTNNYDFLSVLTHEIGHSLGVSHPNRRCSSTDHCYPETMFSCTDAEEFMRRALNAGDRLSVSSLYGVQQ